MTDFRQAMVEIAQNLAKISRVDAKDRGRRLRAAMGYGELKDDDVIALLNLSESTLGRIKRGARPLAPDEAEKVAERCKLPVEFFDMDFWAAASAPNGDVVSQLQSAVEELRATTRRQAADIELLAAEVRRQSEEADPAKTSRPPQAPPPSTQP